jgi:hypothetical protein
MEIQYNFKEMKKIIQTAFRKYLATINPKLDARILDECCSVAEDFSETELDDFVGMYIEYFLK